MNVLVVDDEPLARELMEDNVSKVPFLKLAGSCSNGIEAFAAIHEKQVDLVLLDIQMPGLTGIQFLQSIKTPLLSIFITAYEKYALDGYSLDVVDYLLKPVSFERFLKAVTKANEIFQFRKTPASKHAADFIFVQADYNLVKVPLNEVSHIEGLKDYVKIHLTTATRPVITRMSMKSLEELLPSEKFMRVHKSFIISIDKIISVRKGRIKIGIAEVPLSDSYSDRFYQVIQPQS
ncbi:MAG: LytTR family DNA-binding domain-containing protein [Bacteroidota bacterium]